MIMQWQVKFTKLWMPYSIPICVAIIIGNVIALVVFLKRNFRTKKSNYLLVNMTFADLLVGIFGIVFTIHHFATTGSHGIGENIIATGMIISSNVSMISLSVISFERVSSVFCAIKHRQAKSWYYFVAIGLVWILAVLISSLNVYHISDTHHTNHEIFFYPFLILTIVSLIAISVSYGAIWVKMSYFNTLTNSRSSRESSALSVTLFIVAAISLGTWLPKTVADCIAYANPEKYTVELSVSVTLLLYLNSLLNVIVYTFRMPDFRREFMKIFCKCRQTQVSSVREITVTSLPKTDG